MWGNRLFQFIAVGTVIGIYFGIHSIQHNRALRALVRIEWVRINAPRGVFDYEQPEGTYFAGIVPTGEGVPGHFAKVGLTDYKKHAHTVDG